MSNDKTLAVPRKITTAGNHKLPGDATGGISGTVIDTHGQRQSVGLSIVVVSGLGKKLFSIPEATSEGVVTVFALDGSRIETNGFSLPLQQVAGTRDPFLFNLEESVPNVASPAKADADTWHRLMGHISSKRLELLNKTDDNGVSFKGGVSPYDVCAIGKSTHQAPRRRQHSTSSNLSS